MALIKCRECGKDVSDKARTCVHCGCLVKKKNTKNNTFWIIVISLISMIIFMIILVVTLFMNLSIKKQIPGTYKSENDEIIQLNNDGSCNIISYWIDGRTGQRYKEGSVSCYYEFKRMHVTVSYEDYFGTHNDKYIFNKNFDKLENTENDFTYYKQ